MATAQLAQVVGTQQILDRVFAYNARSVLNLATGNAVRPPDFTNLGISGAAFSTCALTAVNGLYCIDGKQVRNWPNPMDPGTSSVILSCLDPVLGLDGKSDTCTGMTVDQSGAIWLAGKKKNSHSVIKVVKKGLACPSSDWATLGGGALCALEYYSGRPTLVDIASIDGDAAKDFRPCPSCAAQSGVLGMEERKNAVFFPDPRASSPVIAVGSRDWGLSGNEVLQDVALLQVKNGTVVDSYIVATTSTGRILAKNPALVGAARPVFNVPAARGTAARCNLDAQQYGLRAGSTSALLYVSDRNYCQVVVLKPDSVVFNSLVNVQQNNQNLVLSTVDLDANPDVAYPITGLAVAPGISFLVADCAIRCGLVNGGDGSTAAQLLSVDLFAGVPSGAVAFQVKGIPDCRYATAPGFPAALLPQCAVANVVVDPDPLTGLPDVGVPNACGAGPCPAAARWLNVTPLLPGDVASAFKASGLGNGTLPPLLVSPQYRAQSVNGFVFEALFIITNPQIRFRDTFEGEYVVEKLQDSGTRLGCVPADNTLANLIRWDVATTVSEVYQGVGGKYVDRLINIGCGSTKTMSERLSLLPYNLEITPDTYGPTAFSAQPSLTSNNDAVFARLLQKLYGDLRYVQNELACKQVDTTSGTPPVSAGDCGTLDSIWLNGKEKLDKCIEAAFQPKQSSSNENCQSFVSQFTNYRSRLPASTSTADVANRTGELKARVEVIFNLYYTRFLPSIPASGYCREAGTC
ncbi:MAG TPA: hypothetical protein VKO83_06350 [Steroidobacteraceae bacterium]|nr:hypothetical protein [Steroidobacteraceae bacterium]